MEEKEEIKDTQEIIPESKPRKGIFNNKIITVGVPAFIFQLILVYFVTANFLLSKVNENSLKGPAQQENQVKQNNYTPNTESGKFIFAIDDIIVNPAGTDGKRLLLTSIGFDINSEDDKNIFQSKEIMIKDAVITALSSTDLEKLNNFGYRDTLKTLLTSKIKQMIPAVKINRIYFSKFILQ